MRVTDLEKGKPQHGRRPSKKGPNFGDSSGALFSMYSKTAETDDNTLAKRWQKDADGILIFAGLFSAAVASFLTLSIPNLIPNPQDTSAFYLKNIYQHLADPNISVRSTVAAPPTFSPPRYAVTVNLLWVFSLGISLTCAIMATMFQQWARQYVRFTQLPRRGPRKRARIRALFAGSVDKLFIKTMGILLPCYLHLAILLFFLGLIIFLRNVNNTIFINITWFFGFCMTIYSFFTILPLFQPDSLLYTPVSALPATFVVLSTCLIHSTFADRFKFKTWSVFEWLFEDIGNKVEDISSDTSERTLEVDTRILESTLNSLSEDNAMEKFFEAIPDFFGSKSVNLRPTDLSKKLRGTFEETLYEFLDYTFQSTAVADLVKNSRLIICLKASRAALGPNGPPWVLCKILDRNWPKLLQSAEIEHSLKSWANSNDEENVLYIRSLSHLVANAEKRDDRWLALAADQPGLSEDLLRHYPAHGDSVLLSNLINITRLTFRSHLPNWEGFQAIPSKGDGSSTLPSLQHHFCALWNEIVLEAQSSHDTTPILLLKSIRSVYVALHPGTDASPLAFSTDSNILDQPSSYPLCNIASHRSDPTPHDYNEAVEDVSLAIHSSIQPVPHYNAVLVSGTHTFDMPMPQPYTPSVPPSLLTRLDGPTVPTSSLNVAAVEARQGNSDISPHPFMTNLDPHPISTREVASQQSESVVLLSTVNDAKPMVLPSFAGSTVTQPHVPYAQGFASLFPPTARAPIPPPVISDLEAHITTRIRTLHAHDDAPDLNIPIPMAISRHPSKSAPSTPNIAANILLRPTDGHDGANQL